MNGGPDGGKPPYFGRARTAGGLLLIASAPLLVLLDAFRPDYNADSLQLGLMLGSGLVLLGVEAGRKLLGGGS